MRKKYEFVFDRLSDCKRTKYRFGVANILFRLKSVIPAKRAPCFMTGYDVIDSALGGVHRSDIIVLGARVAMGKTAFALDLAHSLSTTANKKVAIFTPASNVENIVDGLKRRANTNCCQNVVLWTESVLDIEVLKDRLNTDDIDFLIIDCLQSFGSEGTKRIVRIKTIMRKLKKFAKEVNVPMLLLTQLSRKIEQRKNPVPTVKDIPSFASIVPFADSILLLYREAYYYPNADRKNAWCLIEKISRGGSGSIPLIWNDQKFGFETPASSCYVK